MTRSYNSKNTCNVRLWLYSYNFIIFCSQSLTYLVVSEHLSMNDLWKCFWSLAGNWCFLLYNSATSFIASVQSGNSCWVAFVSCELLFLCCHMFKLMQIISFANPAVHHVAGKCEGIISIHTELLFLVLGKLGLPRSTGIYVRPFPSKFH